MFARLATERDILAGVDLARLAQIESYPEHVFEPEAVGRTIRAYLKNGNPVFWVVEQRRELVGFLKGSFTPYDWTDGLYATTEVIFVRPDYRGTRAAAYLMREFIRWSDLIGAKEQTGGNDNRLNSGTVERLFEHFGFECVGSFMRRRSGTDGQGRRGRRRRQAGAV